MRRTRSGRRSPSSSNGASLSSRVSSPLDAHICATGRDYDHLASLWEHEHWLPEAAVAEARAHYSAYMVRRVDGLRIITINTDMCACAAGTARAVGLTRRDRVQGELVQLHQHDDARPVRHAAFRDGRAARS